MRMRDGSLLISTSSIHGTQTHTHNWWQSQRTSNYTHVIRLEGEHVLCAHGAMLNHKIIQCNRTEHTNTYI